jgi:hypothetical protein
MKKMFTLLCAAFLMLNFLNAQIVECTPDSECIENVPGNGTVCPLELPPAFVGDYYDETITIIPPSSFEGIPVIHSIRIDDVVGLPVGISWGKDQEMFEVTNPITRYCVNLYGTPETEGEYPLELFITPFGDLFGNPIALPQQVDDTSFVLIVLNTTFAIKNVRESINIYPNPANNNFTVEAKSLESVTVTDILGKELINCKANNEILTIDISNLKNSYYLVRVRTKQGEFVRKLMKY